MNAYLKARWVDALRSGDYKQTLGKLKDNIDSGGVGYCCLGVLCEITNTSYDDGDDMPMIDILRGWGLDKEFQRDGFPVPLYNILAGMNDGDISKNKQYDFEEIADFIENLEF